MCAQEIHGRQWVHGVSTHILLLLPDRRPLTALCLLAPASVRVHVVKIPPAVLVGVDPVPQASCSGASCQPQRPESIKLLVLGDGGISVVLLGMLPLLQSQLFVLTHHVQRGAALVLITVASAVVESLPHRVQPHRPSPVVHLVIIGVDPHAVSICKAARSNWLCVPYHCK